MRPEDRGPVLVKPPGATCAMPIGRDTAITHVAESCLEAVARDKYDGDDPRFEGKTRLEAAVLSLAQDAATDPDARTEFLDRIMGKPKQRIDNTNVNITLSGFLNALAEEEQVVEVEVVEPGDEGMFQ